MNQVQKTIVSLLVTVGLFVAAWAIASEYTSNNWNACDDLNAVPFCFQTTWWIWLIFLNIIGGILYKLWSDK